MTEFMKYLLACNVLDIATGFIRAFDQKNVSSKKMKHGALSKISIWVIIVVSIMLSDYLKTDLTTYVVGYYLVMEVISIFENVSVFVPVPDKLKNMLSTQNTKTEPTKEVSEPEPVKEPVKGEGLQNNIDTRIFEEINKKEE